MVATPSQWRSVFAYACALVALAACLPSSLAVPVSSKRQQVVEMAPTFNTMRKCGVSDGPSPNLHLLLPINKGAAGKNLCKTVLSSIAQGYKPIIVNWESTTTNRELLQLEKVSGAWRRAMAKTRLKAKSHSSVLQPSTTSSTATSTA